MALTLYKLDPANGCTFDDGGGADTINSIVDWSYSETGSTFDGTSDGIATIQSVHTDNIGVDITITSKNPANVTANGWKVGSSNSCGTLVLKGISRTCDGTGGTTLTATCDEAKIVNIEFSVVHEGDSACNITFRCASSTGDPIFIFS